MKNLGFGMMRLPVLSGPTDFDYDQLNQMVDAFLAAGYTYFDTSFVYHDGKSEEATRKALVERYPRNSFTVATKFPTFMMIPEEKIEETFRCQLDNLGVDYIDYYLLHNIQTVSYDGYDGKGGIVKTTHLFEHAKKWKEDGKIRHLGISFHSSAKLLDRVLTEHPEIEFVQIALNPIDWDSELVQAGPCYDVIRKHGRKVIIMEAVKGGGLAKLPEETLEQVLDNTKTSDEAQPLNDAEKEALAEAMRIYRESAPIKQSEIDKYKGLVYHGVPVSAILQAYSICQIQPDPGFSDDNNYLKNAIAEAEHVDFHNGLEKQTVITPDGTDITEIVEKAVVWLTEHSF